MPSAPQKSRGWRRLRRPPGARRHGLRSEGSPALPSSSRGAVRPPRCRRRLRRRPPPAPWRAVALPRQRPRRPRLRNRNSLRSDARHRYATQASRQNPFRYLPVHPSAHAPSASEPLRGSARFRHGSRIARGPSQLAEAEGQSAARGAILLARRENGRAPPAAGTQRGQGRPGREGRQSCGKDGGHRRHNRRGFRDRVQAQGEFQANASHEFEFEESVPEDAAAEGERGVVASAAALPAEAGISGAL